MKKQFLFVILLISSFSVFSQQNEVSTSDFGINHLDLTSNSISSDVIVLFRHFYLGDGDQWIYNTKNTNFYNEDGELEMILGQNIQHDDTFINSFRFLFMYDSFGNRINTTKQIWDEGWVNKSNWIDEYDLNNNLVNSVYQSWYETEWGNYSKKEFKYEEGNSNYFEEVRSLWKNGEWVWDWKILAFFDDNQVKLNETKDKWEDGAWTENTKAEFKYQNELLVERDVYKYMYGSWDQLALTEYEYFDNGNIKS